MYTNRISISLTCVSMYQKLYTSHISCSVPLFQLLYLLYQLLRSPLCPRPYTSVSAGSHPLYQLLYTTVSAVLYPLYQQSCTLVSSALYCLHQLLYAPVSATLYHCTYQLRLIPVLPVSADLYLCINSSMPSVSAALNLLYKLHYTWCDWNQMRRAKYLQYGSR
jgi:hypothetical protein